MNELTDLIIKLLRQISEGIGKVWFVGLLPVYLLLYLLIGIIVMRMTGGAQLAQEIRNFRRQSASEFLRRCLSRFCKMAAVVTLYAVILPPFLTLNLEYDTVLTALNENAYNLCSMVIGLTTMVLTVCVVIILFHKNYYLVFSISDVLKSYHFTGCLGILLGSCLGVCVCTILQLYLPADTLWRKVVLLFLEWCMLSCIVTAGISFWIIYKVMFSNKKVELRLLNRLYLIFRGGERPDESQAGSARDWEFGAVRANVEYLCAEYVSAARTLPIHRVKKLVYLSGEARKESWNRLYKRSLNLLIYAALGVWLFSMIIVSLVLGENGTGILLMNTIMLAVVTIPAMLGFRHRSERAELLFDDTLGYELEIEGKKKIRIPRMILRPSNKYDRFIWKMNSLTGFFCIGLDRGMCPQMTENAIGIVIDWFSDIKEKHSCFYLPVFASGYFAFEKGQKIAAVQKCYADLVLAGRKAGAVKKNFAIEKLLTGSEEEGDTEKIFGTDQTEIDDMLRGHLSDLVRETGTDGTDSAECVKIYMDWLHDGVPQECKGNKDEVG